MPTILLVRHAQASFGTSDYDVLSELGLRQAEALDGELRRRGTRPDVVLCGTMRRQRDTLTAIAQGHEPSIDPGLNEYAADDILAAHTSSALRQQSRDSAPVDPGAQDSRAFQEVLDRGLGSWIAAGDSGPASETFPAFMSRVTRSLRTAGGALGSGQTALLCTSGGVISAACVALMSLPDEAFVAFNRVTVNAGITAIALGRAGATLVSFNEHGYLETGRESLISYR